MRISGSQAVRWLAAVALLACTCSVYGQGRGERGNRGDGQGQFQGRGGGGRGGGFAGGGAGFGGRGGVGGFARFSGGAFEQDYLRRDMPLFIEDLRMDDSQRVIFEMLFTDYEGAFREAMEQYRARQVEMVPELAPEVQQRQQDLRSQMNDLNEQTRRMRDVLPEGAERDQVMEALRNRSGQLRDELRQISQQQQQNQAEQGVFEEMARIQAEWVLHNQQLSIAFIESVMSILTEEQQALWPALDRRFRREKTLDDGQLSGERVNLFHLARDQQIDTTTLEPIQPMLGEYELLLDDALQRRNAYLRSSVSDLTQAYQEQNFKRGLSIVDQQTQLRTAVRDVNDTYAQMMIAALPDETAGAFKTAYRNTAYPRIFQTTRAQRAFAAAKELPDLAPETLEAIVQLEISYLGELAAINEQLVALTKQHEPQNTRRNAEWMVARMSGERVDRPSDPVREAYNERNELDEKYLELLKALLTEEQFESLPGVNRRGRGGERGDGGFGRRGGFGGDNAEFMNQFDADGDGQISDEEREAIREYFRQQRDQGGFGGRGGFGGGGAGGRGGGGQGGGRGGGGRGGG